MLSKRNERKRAIALRKQGYSYGEIRKQVPVSQASLSLWLRHIPLTKEQQRKNETRGRLLGAQTRRRQRLLRREELKIEASESLPRLVKDPFFVLGLALYWAEGSKQKPWNVSEAVRFSNSDSRAVVLMQKWFCLFGGTTKEELIYRLHIHETADIERAKEIWANSLGISADKIYVSIKRNNSVFRKNHTRNELSDYKGLVAVMVRKSAEFNRLIEFWVQGCVEQVLEKDS